MEKNLNPEPQALHPEEQGYDLTDVGDAALLAVLESGISESNESASNEDDIEKPETRDNTTSAGESGSGDNSETDAVKKGEDKPETENEDASATAGNRTAASLLRLAASIISGETPDDTLIPLLDAAAAREAIRQARLEGEIAGRNAIIEERMRREPPGAPDLNGSANLNRGRTTSIFDLAQSAK